MGKIYAVAGPAGVGKNALIKAIGMDVLGLNYIPSYTTRAPRPGETQGKPYYFVSHEEFMNKKHAGDFIEAEEVHGFWYGTDKKRYQEVLSTGGSIIKDIDVKGALRFKELFGSDAVLIYLKPPSLQELRRRLKDRVGVTDSENRRRLLRVSMENRMSTHFDHVFTNDVLEDAVAKLREIVRTGGVTYVNPRDLLFTQTIRNINMHKVETLFRQMVTGDFDLTTPIEVVKDRKGVLYISRGNHQVIAAIKAGEVKVPVLVSHVRWKPFDNLHILQYDYEDLIKSINSRNCITL